MNHVDAVRPRLFEEPAKRRHVHFHFSIIGNPNPSRLEGQVVRSVITVRIAGIHAGMNVRWQMREHRTQDRGYPVHLVKVVVREDRDIHGYAASGSRPGCTVAGLATRSKSSERLNRASS